MFGTYEKDYIMRLVKQAVRMLLKLLFNIDTKVPMEEIMAEALERGSIERLTDMADRGQINEAENELFELIGDGEDRGILKIALIFYYHLSCMDSDFVTANGYSEAEIKEGVESVLDIYGVSDVGELFLK